MYKPKKKKMKQILSGPKIQQSHISREKKVTSDTLNIF